MTARFAQGTEYVRLRSLLRPARFGREAAGGHKVRPYQDESR